MIPDQHIPLRLDDLQKELNMLMSLPQMNTLGLEINFIWHVCPWASGAVSWYCTSDSWWRACVLLLHSHSYSKFQWYDEQCRSATSRSTIEHIWIKSCIGGSIWWLWLMMTRLGLGHRCCELKNEGDSSSSLAAIFNMKCQQRRLKEPTSVESNIQEPSL